MGSFGLPDDPTQDPQQQTPWDGTLTKLEADFLGFLLYQYADGYIESKEQSEWYDALMSKL